MTLWNKIDEIKRLAREVREDVKTTGIPQKHISAIAWYTTEIVIQANKVKEELTR